MENVESGSVAGDRNGFSMMESNWLPACEGSFGPFSLRGSGSATVTGASPGFVVTILDRSCPCPGCGSATTGVAATTSALAAAVAVGGAYTGTPAGIGFALSLIENVMVPTPSKATAAAESKKIARPSLPFFAGNAMTFAPPVSLAG